MAREPGARFLVIVGGVFVQTGVDYLAGRDRSLDRVQEADELLVSMALHIAADHSAVEHVEGGEERGGAVALVVVGQRGAAPWKHPMGINKQPQIA